MTQLQKGEFMRIPLGFLGMIVLVFPCLGPGGCQGPADPEQSRQQIVAADRAFSELSLEAGVAVAFESFADPAAVIYREGSHPIEGIEGIRSLFTPAPTGTLSWEPTTVEVAASGDLGYSLGKYTYVTSDSTGARRQSQGYYVSIWRRQADGTWKFVFDTGVTVPEDAYPGEG